jgi:hypothetical protein
MADCVPCLGVGYHDFNDLDVYLEEHLDDEQLARAKAESSAPWRGRVACEECEGTGVISEERRRELLARARAEIDQLIAKWKEEGRVV